MLILTHTHTSITHSLKAEERGWGGRDEWEWWEEEQRAPREEEVTSAPYRLFQQLKPLIQYLTWMDVQSRQLNCIWLQIRGHLSEAAFFVSLRWIETADYIWQRSALCAKNSILQMICLAVKFPRRILKITSSTLAATALLSAALFLFPRFSLYISHPSLCLSFCVQWSQREPDPGGSKESLQRSCGDQEPVSGTLAVLCMWVCVCTCTCISVYVHAHLSLDFHSVCKCAQPPCAWASIFHCVECHVPPACCIDWHCCSLAAVCVHVCACVCVCAHICVCVYVCVDVTSLAFLLFSFFVLPQS